MKRNRENDFSEAGQEAQHDVDLQLQSVREAIAREKTPERLLELAARLDRLLAMKRRPH